jgi:hypothetical protein
VLICIIVGSAIPDSWMAEIVARIRSFLRTDCLLGRATPTPCHKFVLERVNLDRPDHAIVVAA